MVATASSEWGGHSHFHRIQGAPKAEFRGDLRELLLLLRWGSLNFCGLGRGEKLAVWVREARRGERHYTAKLGSEG